MKLKSPPARLKSPPPLIAGREPAPIETRRSKTWANTAAWQRLRAQVIEEATLSAAARGALLRCCKTGVVLSGQHPAPNSPVVDHIIPHRGDKTLFFDRGNLQIVAKAWHDRVKQSMEKRGLA